MKKKNESVSRAVDRLRIGSKINELRKKKRLALDDLAAKIDLKKTVLAKIEGDEIVPPLGTLLKLSKVLDVSMAYFFEDEVEVEKISITRSGERIQVKGRPYRYEGEVDYVYESLEPKKPGKHIEPFLVEFQPMDISDMVFLSHDGEEFHFVLDGRLEFRTDNRVEVLEPGDSLFFESEISHGFRALADQPARVLAVVWRK